MPIAACLCWYAWLIVHQIIGFLVWERTHDRGVPCQRVAFERLMQEAGFRLRDGEAAGLLLKAELGRRNDDFHNTAEYASVDHRNQRSL